MAEDGEQSKKQMFPQNQEAYQRTQEAQAEHRFPRRPAGIIDLPRGSKGPRSLFLRRHGDSFGFTLRHFILYPPESIRETDGRHAAVGALFDPMDTIFVKHVAEGGPAAHAGLKQGDRLLVVNGEPIGNLTYAQVTQRIKKSPEYLHLLVVPKEDDVLQKYFADSAHNPLSNQHPRETIEERRRQFAHGQAYPWDSPYSDSISWRSNPSSFEYGSLAPRKQPQVHQQKSADNIYSSVRNAPLSLPQQKSAETIYSNPRDSVRRHDRKSLEIYAEPVLNDSSPKPRAQPQVPAFRKMGRRASESSTFSEADVNSDTNTMNSSKSPYLSEYSSLDMPVLSYPNAVGCRLSLDAGNRRESSSSLGSFESSSTITGLDDSVIMNRMRKSVQEKEEFMRRSSNPPSNESSLIQREFYGRPKKLDKPVWPPLEPQESPSRLNKPTHQHFQRVKNDIESEREISSPPLDSQQKNLNKPAKDWQLGKIQEGPADNAQTNGTSIESEDRRNYPPNIKMVSKRARQFESGRPMAEDDPMLNNRTSFYKSELSRLTSKKAVPNVAVRTREFETLSNEPRRDLSGTSTSSNSANLRRSYRDSHSLDSSGSNCSISSSIAENPKFPGNFSIPIGSKFIHCPLPSDYKPTSDLPIENQSNRMRVRSNSADSWMAVMRRGATAATPMDTNHIYGCQSTARTGHEFMDTTPVANTHTHVPDLSPVIIPEPVELLHQRQHQTPPSVSVTPASPAPVHKTIAPVRPTQLDLAAPKRPARHLRPAHATADTTPPPLEPVCDDKPLVVRRTKTTNLSEEDRVTRRESYLKATEVGRMMHFDSSGDYSDGDVSPQVNRSGSVSGGSSSSVSLDREKITGSPTTDRAECGSFVREGQLHCKITEIDGKRFGDRSWKQVWAVLNGPKLFLYKDRHYQSPVGTSEVVDQSLASGIDMRGSCVQVAENYTKRKHVLRVSSVLPCRSELLLQADNTDDLAEWMRSLQERVASCTDVEAKLTQPSGNNKQQAVPQTIPATTSIQISQQSKSKLPNLRNRSPTGQSPVSKTRKPSQVNDPSTSPKLKTWRGRVAKQFRKIHQGASSPSSPTAPEGSTFGNPLEHCLPSNTNQFVPRFVEVCTEIVEERGLETTGIYRVPGNNAAVTALTEEVNKCYDSVLRIDPRWNDVHVVGSLLKSFFRKMPDSLLTAAAYSWFIEADKIENPTLRLEEIRRLVKNLPPHHYNTLQHLIMHLKKVAQHCETNKMDDRNLAIVFGPTIVRDGEENMEKMVNNMNHQCKIVESLLVYADWFFNDESAESLNLPAPIATTEIFNNDDDACTALLKDNISKIEGMNQSKEPKPKELIQSIFFAAQKKYKRKPTKGGQSVTDSKDEPMSPNGHKEFTFEGFQQTSINDLKTGTSECKPNSIPITVTDIEAASEGDMGVYNYRKGTAEFRRRVENFIQETQSNLQRPRKPEYSSNNSLSLDLRTPNEMSASVNSVLRHSGVPTANDSQRVITKTHSASNVFQSRSSSAYRSVTNGRANTIGHNGSYKNDKANSYGSDTSSSSLSEPKSSAALSKLHQQNSAPAPFGLHRIGSAENITGASDTTSSNCGHLKKLKYESENDGSQRSGSLDSLNKTDDGDLVTSITKIMDEKFSKISDEKSSSAQTQLQSSLSRDNIPYADESPEKVLRQSMTYLNKENIPSSPKLYRDPSLHKRRYNTLLTSLNDSAMLKEKQEVKEKDEDSTLCLHLPDNERHITDKKYAAVLNTNGNSKLKRSESLNKPERTASPLNIKLKRSESLNKASDKLKRSDSLTKTEKTESNISKRREITNLSRRTTKDLMKLKRKNGMPERSIKRRHTVGGTKDPDKITLMDNRSQPERHDVSENLTEKNLRTSSPDLSSTRRERFLLEVSFSENMVVALRQHLIGARPQSFPESTVYKVPLESHV